MTRVAFILAAVLICGCSPASPDRVCEHVAALTARVDAGVEQTARRREELRSACLTRLQEMRRQDPEEYAKRARCELQAEDIRDLSICADLWPR